jgi:peptidoglycan biosynthesis protein MviN/MurJ (putative lipid II flippase)
VLGEAAFVIATLASYAHDDTRSPFNGMVVRVVVTVVPAVAALVWLEGTAVLLVLGVAISAGNVASACHLGSRLRAWLPRFGEPVRAPVLRAVGAAALMVVPARAVAALTAGTVDARWRHGAGLAIGGLTGAAVYLFAHRTWRSPELRSWLSSLRSSRPGVT